jgi:hypothetical protein
VSYQQRLFDGYTVTHERGTLGSFQIEDEDIKHFQADGTIVLVVTGTVVGGSFKHDPSGDWVRTNKLVTHEVRVASGVMKDEIVEFYNLGGDQLAFGPSNSSSSAGRSGGAVGSTHVDPSVASGGNPDLDDEDDDDQDFSFADSAGALPGGVQIQATGAARDEALAAFLDESA